MDHRQGDLNQETLETSPSEITANRQATAMNWFDTLHSNDGNSTKLGFDFTASLDELAKCGQIDACILSTEDGFSPLGRSKEVLARELDIPVDDISRLARWNQFENDTVTLIALASLRPNSRLRGLILAPGETAKCYTRVAARHGMPDRSFYYNVTYEAISFVCKEWQARKPGISHLSAAGQFHEDIATCNAEALTQFCDGNLESAPECFIFWGCCIYENHLRGIARLNADRGVTFHRPIFTRVETNGEARLIHLDWQTRGTGNG